MIRSSILFGLALLFPQTLQAGTYGWHGKEVGFWNRCSVVYATFLQEKVGDKGTRVIDKDGYYYWAVQIHATVSGPFDAMCSSLSEQVIAVKAGHGCALELVDPEPNSHVLLLIDTSSKAHPIELGCGAVLFFPSACPVQPVTDLTDSTAAKVMENLRKIRHQSRESGKVQSQSK